MLAAMFYAPMDLRLENRPVPRPGPGEVVVQVAVATTCGTDVKTFRRGHPLLFRETPAGFGHEAAGVISSVGAGVAQWREGDRVVVANSAPCLSCFYCRRRRFTLCENLLLLNGAFAEYLLVPERIVRLNLHHVPQETSFVAAALTEPLACAVHGIDACAIEPGDTVVIVGSGPLGLLLTAAARLRGARVIVTGHGAERLALARSFGADTIINTAGMLTEVQCDAVVEKTEGRRGADIVIEAIGTPETWEMAARMARPGGLVNFFGGCPASTSVALPTYPVHYGELTMKGVFHHTPAYFAQALDLIVRRQIDVEALVTARMPLAAVLEAFDFLLHRQGMKYALIPPAFEHEFMPARPG